jgi:hypothetical protein
MQQLQREKLLNPLLHTARKSFIFGVKKGTSRTTQTYVGIVGTPYEY